MLLRRGLGFIVLMLALLVKGFVPVNEVERTPRWLRRYKWATLLCVLSLILSVAPVAAQEGTAGAERLEECAAVEETALADELNALTQGVLGTALDQIDIRAIVDAQWQELGINAVVAEEVDAAVERVRSDQDFWNTFLSGWSADKAEELTLAVANGAFASEGFRKAIEDLNSAVAASIGAQVSVLSAEGASSAAHCLQTFIRANYAPVLVESFQREVERATGGTEIEEADLPSTLLMAINQHKVALGGVGVIIATQIAKRLVVRLSERVAQRVAGRITARVLGRLGTTVIPLAGWIIGGGMIAYDIYSGRDGALPQIQEQLKDEEVAAGIREEIAGAIEPELRTEIPGVARDLANGLYSQWSAVRSDLRVLLELAAQNAQFAALLDRVQGEEELQHFVALNRALLGVVGRDGVLAAAESGDLARALPVGETIAPVVAATGSLESALAWVESSGDRIDEVVANEIYKVKQPGELTRAQLERLIALDNPAMIVKLGALPVDQLNSLLAISSATLEQLAQTLSTEHLGWLATAVQGRSQSDVNLLVGTLANNPQLVRTIQEKGLLDALPADADLYGAVSFISGPEDPMSIINDAVEVMTSAPTWSLFRVKYGWGVTALTIAIIVLLVLVVVRMVWGLIEWLLRPLSIGGRK